MSKIKKTFLNGFTVCSNEMLKDMNLNLKDRGLLITMLSLPDGWNFNIRGLASILPDGRDAVQNTLKRLEVAGYLKREQVKTPTGTYGDIEYNFSDAPIFKNTMMAEKVRKDQIANAFVQNELFDETVPTEGVFVKNPDNQDFQPSLDDINACLTLPCTENTDTGNQYTENLPQYNKQELNTQQLNKKESSSSSLTTSCTGKSDDEEPSLDKMKHIRSSKISDEDFMKICKDKYDYDDYVDSYKREYRYNDYCDILSIIHLSLNNDMIEIKLHNKILSADEIHKKLLALNGNDIDTAMYKISAYNKTINNVYGFTLKTLLTIKEGQSLYWQSVVNEDRTK